MEDLIALLIIASVFIIKATNVKGKKTMAAPASSKSATPVRGETVPAETMQAERAQAAEAVEERAHKAETVAEKGTPVRMTGTGQPGKSSGQSVIKVATDSPSTTATGSVPDPENLIIYSEILSPGWEKY